MKNKKLLFIGIGVFICGVLRGLAPTVVGLPFDISSFLIISVISLIILIIALIKSKKEK